MSFIIALTDRLMMKGASHLLAVAWRHMGANKFAVLREISAGRTMLTALSLVAVPYAVIGPWESIFVVLAITRVPYAIDRWKTLHRKVANLNSVRGFEREMTRVGKAMIRHERYVWFSVPFCLSLIAFFGLMSVRSFALYGTDGMGVALAIWTVMMFAGFFASYVDLQPPATPGARREESMAAFQTVTASR